MKFKFSRSQGKWECDLNLTYPPFKLNGLRTTGPCILQLSHLYICRCKKKLLKAFILNTSYSSTHERKSRTNVVVKDGRFYLNHNSLNEVLNMLCVKWLHTRYNCLIIVHSNPIFLIQSL